MTEYRILIVDDNKTVADFMGDMLRILGHTVEIACGPRPALHKLIEKLPDLLFLDVNMPGVDGLEVCRYLRRDPRMCKLPIVIVSADGDRAHKEAGLMAGANAYLVKPVMLDDLEEVVERVMTPKTNVTPAPVKPLR